MDTSDEYIKMCLLADRDLRPLYKFQRGDWIFSYFDDYKIKILSDYIIAVSDNCSYHTLAFSTSLGAEMNLTTLTNRIDKVDFKRLPEQAWTRLHRQDQLQEMIIERYIDNVGLFEDFTEFARENFSMICPNIRPRFESFEIIWLAFVMEKKFNKHWNGVTWEVIK